MGEEAFNKLQPNILLISFYTINEMAWKKIYLLSFPYLSLGIKPLMDSMVMREQDLDLQKQGEWD